jgi:hypothetical protein
LGWLLGFGWIFCFRHVGTLRQTDSKHNSRFKIQRGKMQNLVKKAVIKHNEWPAGVCLAKIQNPNMKAGLT